MFGVIDHLGWGAILMVFPVTALTICVVLVALAALTARRPATRRHCLSVITHLTQYLRALRSQR